MNGSTNLVCELPRVSSTRLPVAGSGSFVKGASGRKLVAS